jgi:hypothetical protein
LKCSICKNSFDSNEITKRSNKNYCKECLKKHEEEVKENRKDSDLLFDYICEIFNIKQPTGLMFKQMKDFRGTEYNYTNIGMYYTLKYYYKILEGKFIDGGGIGIIPYYYEKAKEHYKKVFDLEDIIEDFKSKEQVINIKTKIMNRKQDIKKPLPLQIDWEENNEDI